LLLQVQWLGLASPSFFEEGFIVNLQVLDLIADHAFSNARLSGGPNICMDYFAENRFLFCFKEPDAGSLCQRFEFIDGTGIV
jgi:hypothetical protein